MQSSPLLRQDAAFPVSFARWLTHGARLECRICFLTDSASSAILYPRTQAAFRQGSQNIICIIPHGLSSFLVYECVFQGFLKIAAMAPNAILGMICVKCMTVLYSQQENQSQHLRASSMNPVLASLKKHVPSVIAFILHPDHCQKMSGVIWKVLLGAENC